MSLRRAVFTLALASLVACAVSASDDPEPPPAELGDIHNLHTAIVRWDFEPASADCNGWTASAATSIRAVPSHSGAYACKLCADGSSNTMTLTHALSALTPGRYLVSAWLRRRADGGDDDSVAAHVRLDQAPESAGKPSSITLKKDWYLLSDEIEIAKDTASVTVVAHTSGAPVCILVDDVVVERTDAYSTNLAPRKDK